MEKDSYFLYGLNQKKTDYKGYLMMLFGLLSMGVMGVNLYYLIILGNDMGEMKGYVDYFMSNKTKVEIVSRDMECLLEEIMKWMNCK